MVARPGLVESTLAKEATRIRGKGVPQMKPARKSRPDLNKLDEKERAELLSLMEDQEQHYITVLHSIPRPKYPDKPFKPEIDPETGLFVMRVPCVTPYKGPHKIIRI
jgi:hypothetical protein